MPYALAGPQIEPQAAHWTYDGYRIRVTDVHSDHPTGNVVPPYDTNPAILEYEIQELVDLAGKRTSAADITGTFNPVLINDSNNQPIQDVRPRSRYALSAFFRLRPPPITAQFNTANWQIQCDCDPANPDEDVFVRPVVDIFDQCNMGGPPIVTNGQELARMFEAETPGLMHRHARNCLLFVRPSVSPPRQARVWMALDLAIYSALVAAWHVKWGHRQGGTHVNDPQANQADYTRSYRERPIEYELRVAQQTSQLPRFEVLYDYELNPDGTERGPRRCPNAFVSPGTPRHPAYPSGHSTYSAAASHTLEYFFSRDTLDLSDDEVFALPEAAQPGTGPWVAAELRRLADNIGVARLWAGVHWRQDHTTGQSLGRWVAKDLIDQLCRDPVEPLQPAPDPCDSGIQPPSFSRVEDHKRYRDSRNNQCDPDHDLLPEPESQALIRSRQPQRGGAAT